MKGNQIGMLARTLARNNGIRVTISGTDSWWSAIDKHLNISAQVAIAFENAPPDKRQQLKNALCGLVFHEALHATDTTVDKPAGLRGDIMNILEDGRIEHLGVMRRPGARIDFLAVCTFYAAGPANPPSSLADAVVLFMLGKVRAGFLQQEPMTPYIDLGYRALSHMLGSHKTDKLASLLTTDVLKSLSDSHDVLKLSDRMIKIIGDIPPQPSAKSGESKQNSNQNDITNGTASNKDIQDAIEKGSSLRELSEKVLDEIDQPYTPTSNRIQIAAVEYESVKERQKYEHSIVLKAAPLSRSTLQKLLLSSDKVEHSSHSKGKKLGRNLVDIFTEENPKPFDKKSETSAIKTAVSIWLDDSSSMNDFNKIGCATTATYALCKALETLPGIAIEANTFASNLKNLKPFESRAKPEYFPSRGRGGTRAHLALAVGRISLFSRPEERKVIILLSDGVPSDSEALKLQINICRQAGIEIFAIGICHSGIKTYWPEAPIINNPHELEKALFGLASNKLKNK